MYYRKYETGRLYHGRRTRHTNKKKAGLFLISLLILVIVVIGGTVAYLVTNTVPVQNSFTPASVACEVTEAFDGNTKSHVNVINTGNTDAYIRVKLVTYRVNQEGQHMGGMAAIPHFDSGENWVYYEGYYYYTLPVEPGGKPAANLINRVQLSASYDDADGGRQVIEVMAEAIQSSPAEAAGSSWGVSISEGSVTAYPEN